MPEHLIQVDDAPLRVHQENGITFHTKPHPMFESKGREPLPGDADFDMSKHTRAQHLVGYMAVSSHNPEEYVSPLSGNLRFHADQPRYSIDEPTSELGFDQALLYLKAGERVSRTGWNGKNMWVKAQYPDQHSKMSLPYLYLRTADGQQVPWLPSQADLMANDWSLLDA